MNGVRVTDNQQQFAAHLRNVRLKELPFATVKALNRTATDAIIPAEKRAMVRQLDRPKRFTLNAMRVNFAKKTNPIATVLFKDAPDGKGATAGKYLQPVALGKRRRDKGFDKKLRGMGVLKSDEYAVPGRGLKLDRSGNVSRAQLRKMISAVADGATAGNHIFAGTVKVQEKGEPGGKKVRGIWQSKGKGPNRQVIPLMLFVTKRKNFTVQFKFEDVAKRVAMKAFPGIMGKEWDRAALSSRYL